MKYKIALDGFLSKNWLFVKSISFLFHSQGCDLIFIPQFKEVIIKLKTTTGSSVLTSINKNIYENMIFSLKLACSLNVIEKNIIQSTRVSANINDELYGFRCSFHPSVNGDCLAIRIINKNYFSSVNIDLKPGLTLIAGPTGSGKTTLFYSILSSFSDHIVSLEDPVEYELNNVCQTNVQQITYSQALKSVLRQSPKIIAIGEIRDEDSANCVINASLTGHSIICTIHANSIENVYNRLKELNCHLFKNVIKRIILIKDFVYTIHDIE